MSEQRTGQPQAALAKRPVMLTQLSERCLITRKPRNHLVPDAGVAAHWGAGANSPRIHADDVEMRAHGGGEQGGPQRLERDDVRGGAARTARIEDEAADPLIQVERRQAIQSNRDLPALRLAVIEGDRQGRALQTRWELRRTGTPDKSRGGRLGARWGETADH